MAKKDEGVVFPEDITSLSNEEIDDLEQKAVAEFDSLSQGDVDAEGLENLRTLATGIQSLRETRTTRTQEAEARAAEQKSLIEGVNAGRQNGDGTEDGGSDGGSTEPAAPSDSAGAPVAVTAGGATTKPRESGTRGLNKPLSLAEITQKQGSQKVPERRSESVLIASADIPNFAVGSRLNDMNALVAAMQSRARALPIQARGDDTSRYPIASLQREYRYTLDMMADPSEVDAVLQAATDVDALVAAGGWCSPSEISYDFFNIVCVDGTLDLPTVGINRGGMRWPTSASFGDLVGNAAMWSWNETQDIAAATGTAQSGTKTCARVPCPSFNEARLACDGLCLTVGNLTEDAYPELIANHTRLLFAANAHKINGKRIAQLVAASTAVTGDGNATGAGVVAPVLGSLSLQAIDYRDKFAMCDGAILEVLLPRWIRGAMRSDLRKRMGGGMEMLEVADARLMSMFDAEGLRVQWVNDWQVRAAGFPGNSTAITAWPTQVRALMYAPGTFVLGQGLRLDLGLIRDSVMNATNDHTAEWMEECWLIAQVGHESRNILVNICPDGTTGAADLTACGV